MLRSSHVRQIGVGIGPEVTEADEGFAAGIVEQHPFGGGLAVAKTSSWVVSPNRMKFGLSTASLPIGPASLDDGQSVSRPGP